MSITSIGRDRAVQPEEFSQVFEEMGYDLEPDTDRDTFIARFAQVATDRGWLYTPLGWIGPHSLAQVCDQVRAWAAAEVMAVREVDEFIASGGVFEQLWDDGEEVR